MTKLQWVKVTTRAADEKERAREAKQFEAEYGTPRHDPDEFGMAIAYSVQHYGFLGAFEKAKEYIAKNKLNNGDRFEYQIDGGEW